MKIKIYMNTDGQELHAQGKQLWSWHLTARLENLHESAPPKGGILLGELEVELPGKDACIAPVLEALKDREQQINATAHEDLAAIKLRRDNLLALTYEEPV